MFESKALLNKVDYLDEEREKIWKRLIELEDIITRPLEDDKKAASYASRKAAEFKNKAEKRLDEANIILQEIINVQSQIQENRDHIVSYAEDSKGNLDSIKISLNSIEEKKGELEASLDNFSNFFDEHPDLENDIIDATDKVQDVESSHTKVNTIVSSITSKIREIDDAYTKIFGFEEVDEETDTEVHVDGVKDRLEGDIDELKNEVTRLEKVIDEIIEKKEKRTDLVIENWEAKYGELDKKISELLPNALTAGLSSAYSEKKTEEKENLKKLNLRFNAGIVGLIFVSSISVWISIYFIYDGMKLIDVINILPKMATAFIPIYIPLVWFTITSNKRLKLSKRIIEEYTHKEVISKTYQGLSTQIEDLEMEDSSLELKLKLLYSLLQITNENPGKLISDYKRMDHPIVDALGYQNQLENSLDRLKNFPGISKLRQILLDKRFEKMEKKAEQINDLIDKVEDVVNK